MESTEIKVKGSIKDLGSKDGRKFDLKLEITPARDLLPDLYDLQAHGDVEVALKLAQSLPKDKPADVPGQGQLFGKDGKPRFHIRCETCHTETTQKLFAQGKGYKTYECDVCHSLNQVDDPESAESAGEGAATSRDSSAPPATEPVPCPKCGTVMRYEADGNWWVCTNPECEEAMHEEVRLHGPVPCPDCDEPMDYDGDKDEWCCRRCDQTISGADIRATAEAEKSPDGEGEDPAKPILICPECGEHELIRSEDGDAWECAGETCGHWVTDEEAQRLLAEKAAAAAEADGGDEDGDESEEPSEILGKVRHWCQMCQVENDHDLVIVNGQKKLRCADCGHLYAYHERKQTTGEEAEEGAA